MIIKFLQKEYKRVALKYNLTEEQVKEIFESQFSFARLAMKEGEHDNKETFKNINFIKFGKLYARGDMIDRMKKSNDKRRLKEQEEKEEEQLNNQIEEKKEDE